MEETVGNGAGTAAHASRAAATPTPRVDRGKFGRGNTFAKGYGRPKSTVTAALRDRLEPDRLAEILTGLIEDEDTPIRERMRAIELAYNYLDGKPVARSITAQLGAAELLPDLAKLGPADRRRAALELRQRAKSGELTKILDAEPMEVIDVES